MKANIALFSKILITVAFFVIIVAIIGTKPIQFGKTIDNTLTTQIRLSPTEHEISAGEEISIEIGIDKVSSESRQDFLVKYALYDNNGKSLYEGKQTVALLTKTSVVASLYVPTSTPEGKCTIKVQILNMETNEMVGTAEETIIISAKPYSSISRGDLEFIEMYFALIILIISAGLLTIKKTSPSTKNTRLVDIKDIEKYMKRFKHK